MSCITRFVVYTGTRFPEITGQKVSVYDLSVIAKINHGTLYSRIKKAGWVKSIDDSFLVEAQPHVSHEGYYIDGNFFRSSEEIARRVSKSSYWVRTRIKHMGKREFTMDELKKCKPPARKKKKASGDVTEKKDRKYGGSQSKENKLYQDPDYLPHIKWGDLMHLSDTKNTGAGKGEIPGVVLISTKRDSMAPASINLYRNVFA